MANEWLRLWHDMPNDPKWRTVARISGQPISLVVSVYVHLLVDASRNVTRGHASVTVEDIASALDVTEAEIRPILDAMQTRVLDGIRLLGWEKRQPKREDSGDENTGAKSAAQRKKEQREREKQAMESSPGSSDSAPCHDASRNVTLDKDKDKDKSLGAQRGSRLPRDWHPSPEEAEFCKRERPDLRPSEVAKRFFDYWTAIPGSKGRKADWSATWRNWVRNEKPGNAAGDAPAKKDWI